MGRSPRFSPAPGRQIPPTILSTLLLVLALAAPAVAGGISKIAYSSFQGSSSPQVWLACPDGTNALRLTSHPAGGDGAAISPEGTRIVFESPRRYYAQLYVINTDGTSEQRVLGYDFYGQSGTWSPDGARIAFVHSSNNGQPGGTGSIWVVRTDGTGLARLSPSGVDDWDPTWSPDGTRIAFTSYAAGQGQIWLMNADGSGRQPVTSGTASRMGPHWSTDGTKLVYSLLPTPGSYVASSIHVMDPDGTHDRAVTDSVGLNGRACWSPDGSEIAFHSNRGGNFRVYRVDADGTDLRQVTAGATAPGDWGGDWRIVTLPAGVDDAARGAGLELRAQNPVRARSAIRFSTPREADTRLEVFDGAGRLVRTLLRQRLGAGAHTSTWDGRDDSGRACPAGVYHCRLVSGEASRGARLVLVR